MTAVYRKWHTSKYSLAVVVVGRKDSSSGFGLVPGRARTETFPLFNFFKRVVQSVENSRSQTTHGAPKLLLCPKRKNLSACRPPGH